MKRSALHGRALAFGLFLATLAGCGGQGAQLTELNDWMANSNQKIGKAAQTFRLKIDGLRRNEQVSPEAVKNAHDNLKNTILQVREEWKTIKVPDVDAAKELHQAYATFLNGEFESAEGELASVVREVQAEGKAPAEKWTEINKLLSQVGQRENNDLQELQKTKMAFNKKVGMEPYLPKKR